MGTLGGYLNNDRHQYWRDYWNEHQHNDCPSCDGRKTRRAELCITCSNKSRRLPMPNELADRTGAKYHRKWCNLDPERYRLIGKKYRQTHSEVMQAKDRRWRESNRERYLLLHRIHTAKRNATLIASPSCDFTKDDWQDLLEQNDFICIYCGNKEPLTIDHVVPLSKGGSHTKSNIVPACRSCNSKKATKTREDFEKEIILIGGQKWQEK